MKFMPYTASELYMSHIILSTGSCELHMVLQPIPILYEVYTAVMSEKAWQMQRKSPTLECSGTTVVPRCEDVCKDGKKSEISLTAKSYYSHCICPNFNTSFLADFKLLKKPSFCFLLNVYILILETNSLLYSCKKH